MSEKQAKGTVSGAPYAPIAGAQLLARWRSFPEADDAALRALREPAIAQAVMGIWVSPRDAVCKTHPPAPRSDPIHGLLPGMGHRSLDGEKLTSASREK